MGKKYQIAADPTAAISRNGQNIGRVEYDMKSRTWTAILTMHLHFDERSFNTYGVSFSLDEAVKQADGEMYQFSHTLLKKLSAASKAADADFIISCDYPPICMATLKIDHPSIPKIMELSSTDACDAINQTRDELQSIITAIEQQITLFFYWENEPCKKN